MQNVVTQTIWSLNFDSMREFSAATKKHALNSEPLSTEHTYKKEFFWFHSIFGHNWALTNYKYEWNTEQFFRHRFCIHWVESECVKKHEKRFYFLFWQWNQQWKFSPSVWRNRQNDQLIVRLIYNSNPLSWTLSIDFVSDKINRFPFSTYIRQ